MPGVGYHRFVRFAKETIYGEPNFRSARMEFGPVLNGTNQIASDAVFSKGARAGQSDYP